MSILNSLSSAALRQAAVIKDKIQSLEGELSRVLRGTTIKVEVTVPKGRPAGKTSKATAAKKKPATAKAAPVAARKKPKISAAGIARIKAAQKARWAKINAAKAASAK
jgi:hypothetical protein